MNFNGGLIDGRLIFKHSYLAGNNFQGCFSVDTSGGTSYIHINHERPREHNERREQEQRDRERHQRDRERREREQREREYQRERQQRRYAQRHYEELCEEVRGISFVVMLLIIILWMVKFSW